MSYNESELEKIIKRYEKDKAKANDDLDSYEDSNYDSDDYDPYDEYEDSDIYLKAKEKYDL